jgi:uncharacterized membrane protein
MEQKQDLPSYPNPEIANQLQSTPPAKGFIDAFSLTGKSIGILKLTWRTLLTLAVVPVAFFIVALVFSAFNTGSEGDGSNAAASIVVFITGVIAMVSVALIVPAFDLTLLKGAKGEQPTFKDVFRPGLSFFWRYIGMSILVGLLTIIGFILLIVPGLFVMKWFLLSSYYLLDRNVGVIDAMKMSMEASKRYNGPIWGVVGVQILINLIGTIPILGWIPSFIWGILYLGAPAARYIEVKTADAGTDASHTDDMSAVAAS